MFSSTFDVAKLGRYDNCLCTKTNGILTIIIYLMIAVRSVCGKFTETTGSITIITVFFHAMTRIRRKRITFVVDQILIYYG